MGTFIFLRLYHSGPTCFLFVFLCRHFNFSVAKSLHSTIQLYNSGYNSLQMEN